MARTVCTDESITTHVGAAARSRVIGAAAVMRVGRNGHSEEDEREMDLGNTVDECVSLSGWQRLSYKLTGSVLIWCGWAPHGYRGLDAART
jgi:hypothetical protein